MASQIAKAVLFLAVLQAAAAFSSCTPTPTLRAKPAVCMVSASMYEKIEQKLTSGLKPVGNPQCAQEHGLQIKLEIVDNSSQHAGHAGVNGRSGETHYAVDIVSNEFEGLRAVQRHQLVYKLLKDEMEGGREAGGIHALEIKARTETEAS